MIEGVRLLPWMAVHERLRQPRFKCNTCMAAYDTQTRSRMRCGWVRTSRWAPADKQTKGWGFLPGSPIAEPETCPGYTTQLPEVLEAARAWGWEQKSTGAVRRYEALGWAFDSNVSALLDLFAGEQASAERYEMDERQTRAGRR